MFEDLNYQCSLEELYPSELGLMIHKSSFSGIFLKILKLFYHCLRSLNPFLKKTELPSSGIDTLVVICSLNQYRALAKLIKDIPNTLVLSTFPIECENNIVINTRGNSWESLINIPRLIINIILYKGFKHKSMIFHFDDYLNSPGVYDYALKQLKKIKPKSLLVANDHVFMTRAYFRAAQKQGIKTIYAQHAPVSNLFPALEFDYAFLDGQETLHKYTMNGKKKMSDVFFSGSPRFDNIPLIPEVNIYDLGIAINILDNKDKVLNLVKMLVVNKINFILRPHPALPDINFWRQYCTENRIGYSDPLVDCPITFISSSKCFVAGDSGLHLEVALCKKISYYFNFQNYGESDCYDFIKEGFVEVKSEKELIDILTSKERKAISVDKIKYYVANFGTEYWGKSAEVISMTINEINSGKKFSRWQNRNGKDKIFELKYNCYAGKIV